MIGLNSFWLEKKVNQERQSQKKSLLNRQPSPPTVNRAGLCPQPPFKKAEQKTLVRTEPAYSD